MEYKKYTSHLGIDRLTDFQEEVVAKYAQQRNLLLHAPTGSGKTLAFLLTALQEIQPDIASTQVLIISPTRELSLQIEEVWKKMKTSFKSTICYGGHAMRTEENSLSETPTLIIGTPGRLCDHLHRGNLNLDEVRLFIIDEYDKVLEMGFEDQLNSLLAALNGHQKNVLVSATKLKFFPSGFAKKDFYEIEGALINPKGQLQSFKIESTEESKFEDLFRLLCQLNNEKTLVFCNFRERTEEVYNYMHHKGLSCELYHGGLEQEQRERALIKFRNGSANTLVCTDLGARGLDIPEVGNVIHFQYPTSEEAFIHRTGRTARMNAKGAVFLFLLAGTEIPEYLDTNVNAFTLKPIKSVPKAQWSTLYFSAGKKDKINKVDLLGFLIQKGQLEKEEVGVISVLDYMSFVAVKKDRTATLLQELRLHKVKGKKLRIAIAK